MASPYTPASPHLKIISPSALDPRSNAEIETYIQTSRPITSSKNVWTYWDRGFSAMPGWRQRNIIDWARRLGPSWEIRVLDSVPESQHNFKLWAPLDLIAPAVIEGTMEGPHAAHHSSDLIRLPLIWKYGGVWLDSGFMLFRHLDDICWTAISDPKTPYLVAGTRYKRQWPDETLKASFMNSFIAAEAENPLILAWHQVFLQAWGSRTKSTGISDSPLLKPFKGYYPSEILKRALPHSKVTDWVQHLNDYLGHILSLEKAISSCDAATGFNGHEYWTKHMLLISLHELYPLWPYIDPTGYSEPEIIRLFALPYTDPATLAANPSEDQLAAQRLVETTMSQACFKKFSAGLYEGTSVAGAWDQKEQDIVEGTWAAYLRWGCSHLVQEREIPYQKAMDALPEGPVTSKVWKVGVLEPITDETELMLVETSPKS